MAHFGRATTVSVGGAYAAQALGYAAVVTALPAFKASEGLDDTAVSLILLGTCAAAALGSVFADLIAVRWGSRQALVAGFLVQAAAITVAAIGVPTLAFVLAMTVYGIGLGTVDAASNMQGVLVQGRSAVPLLGRLYAAYTLAAVVGALTMSAFVASSGAAAGALLVAAVVQLGVAVAGMRWFDRDRAAHRVHDDAVGRPPLPRRGIWAIGAIVLAAFVVDSSVSTWSSIYLADGLHAAAAVAPLGYAAYQAVVFLTRVGADPLVRRRGRAPVALAATAIGVVGTLLVALVPTWAGAVIGFALAGAATGVLVPIAFSAAGELLPARSDEIVARVNLFNYVGVVVGAVALGLVSGGRGLGVAFVLPAAVLIAAIPIIRRLGGRSSAALPAPDGAAAD